MKKFLVLLLIASSTPASWCMEPDEEQTPAARLWIELAMPDSMGLAGVELHVNAARQELQENPAALFQACFKNEVQRVKYFILAKADLNQPPVGAGNHTYLTAAIAHNANDVAKVLIEHGTPWDFTLLHSATAAGNVDGARFLLERGISVNNKARRRAHHNVSPLHALAYEQGPNKEAMAEILLAAGAHVNVQNDIGQTPLHIATLERHPDVIHRLLSYCMPSRNTEITIESGTEELDELMQEHEEAPIKKLEELALQYLDINFQKLNQGNILATLQALDPQLYNIFIEYPQFAQCLERNQQVTLLIRCCNEHLAFIKYIIAIQDNNGNTARATAEDEMQRIGNLEYLAKLRAIIELLDGVNNARSFQELGEFGQDIIKQYAQHHGIWPISFDDFPIHQEIEEQIEIAPQSWLTFFANALNTVRERYSI